MAQYEKDGVLHTLGTSMDDPNNEGYRIIPNEDWLIENGWTLVIPEIPEPVPTPKSTPAEMRKMVYANDPIIYWENELITVDAANSLFNAYLAEGNTIIATELSGLIATAKAEIRERYPDVEEATDDI